MAQEFVKTKLKEDKVVIFLKPSCPYCVMAKEVLSNSNCSTGLHWRGVYWWRQRCIRVGQQWGTGGDAAVYWCSAVSTG
ncbi:hypothetical protein AGOR_G00007850 [Albula goreensis]|uniref:Glutaredoxin-1 n=1 Tax=Albula goreensis TaxID=1534307 RepID=A0A8T3EBI8_9TELE|nr:hypothetical protein AGOR_G00007850 [Albula goreensis]